MDERALEAFMGAFDGHGLDERIYRTMDQKIVAGLEAYEAAKWRPIEDFDQQPPDDPNGVVYYRGELYLARSCAVVRNAMYRTIDPPSPASTPPAAEDAS